MPLYEYKCDNCGETFETLQHFSDKPLTVHPACGGGPVVRLLSPSALHFKGSGWYVTDYGRGGSKPAPTSSKSDSSKSESSSTTPPAPAPAKSDSTPKPASTKA